MKKIVAGIAALVLLTGTMSGCVKKEAADGKYRIEWYYVGDNQVDVEAVEKEINKYIADDVNATIKFKPLDWGGIKEKTNVMAAGGEKFDIFYLSDQYNSLVGKNALLPIDDLLDKYGSGIKEAIGSDILNALKVNGKIYAVPVNKEFAHNYGILYQKEIADKYGLSEQLESIKSYDDLDPILEVIKKNEPQLYPVIGAVGCNDTDLIFEPAVFPTGFYVGSKDGKVVNMIDTPEYMEAAKKIRARYEKGYMAEGGTVAQAEEKFFIRTYPLKPGKDVEMSAKIQWKQVDVTAPITTTNDITSALMGISRTSKNPETVMKFLNKVYTDKHLVNLMVYGIEGKHYEKIADNRIKTIKDGGYDNANCRWEFFNCFNQYLLEADDEQKNEKLKEYNEAATRSEYVGFNPNTDNIKTQVGACTNVKEEFEQQIADGVQDPEKLVKKYREKLKLAGAEDIVKEIQRQYDEWAASR